MFYNNNIYDRNTDSPSVAILHPKEPFCGGTNHNIVWESINKKSFKILFICTRCGDKKIIRMLGKFFI